MDEQRIIEALSMDYAAGTEAFRDELLARCLDALGSGSSTDDQDLPDEELDMLAAAGDRFAAESMLDEVE